MKNIVYNISFLLLLLFTLTSCGRNSLDIEPLNYEFNDSDSIYEDGEDGSTDRWIVKNGYPVENVNIGANGSSRSIFLRQNWYEDDNGKIINGAHYELEIGNENQFILEFDKMKKSAKTKHCFTVGVKLDTTQGERHISFNTFYDKEGVSANAQWIIDDTIKEIVFPLSMDYVKISNVWKHLRFDLVKYLHEFEPDNDINSVIAFYFQGGDDYLDNIRLVSE
jgi:hypothetical protein